MPPPLCPKVQLITASHYMLARQLNFSPYTTIPHTKNGTTGKIYRPNYFYCIITIIHNENVSENLAKKKIKPLLKI